MRGTRVYLQYLHKIITPVTCEIELYGEVWKSVKVLLFKGRINHGVIYEYDPVCAKGVFAVCVCV